ncbi:MAG: acyl-CoA thioester hydrolase/BAAT C-terminal domain-containing protein [Bacteroidota bacterium]
MKKFLIFLGACLVLGCVFLFSYTPSLSEKHGQIDTKLFIGDSFQQALIVAFGGGGGKNDWARPYMAEKRALLLEKGYAILAIAYFASSEHTPEELDRISLNAIADSILDIARRHPKIDENKIALIGGSKGGELVLNLACRYEEFKAVAALSSSHVSFPALTPFANTSSWMYEGNEVPYVPAPLSTIGPALKGDLYAAFELMLEDEEAAKLAEIEVENIQGGILLISAKDDEQWAASRMSRKMMARLAEKDFSFPYEHIELEQGGHVEPLNHLDKVIQFFDQQFK